MQKLRHVHKASQTVGPGCIATRDRYDDGGFSGGNLDRPGLKQLLADIDDGLTPEVVTQVLAALKRDQVSEAEAIAALHDFNTLWAQLFPLEQTRIIQLLVRRVTVTAVGLEVDIRREGVAVVIREMIAPRDMEAAE